MVGPDLKGITKRRTNEWLVMFIQSPSKMLKSGDAQARVLFQEFNNTPMPDNALTVDQVNQILEYIDGGKAGNSIDTQKVALQNKIDSILKTNSIQDIERGRDLFYGALIFENEGAACISCHNAAYNKISRGGTLAKDLTKAYSRLGGFAGIKGIVASPPFPSMAETYKNHSITDEESAYIMLFLKGTDFQNKTEQAINKAGFVYSALIVGFIMTVCIALLWFRRRHRSVNNSILKRQERYSM